MSVQGDFSLHYETENNRHYTTLCCYQQNQFIRLEPNFSLQDYDSRVSEIFSRKLDQNSIANIMSFTGEMCYNKVFMVLNDQGFMKKSHHLENQPLGFRKVISLLRLNTFCNIKILNGKTLYQAFPLGRIQRSETIFLKIEQNDITFVTEEVTADFNSYHSFNVHGPRTGSFNKKIEYLTIMEMILNRFEHDGLMIKPFRPAKSNLSRTKYEIMMGVLSHYHKKLINASFYWKIDKIRLNRINQIIEETDRDQEGVRIASSFQLPAIEKMKVVRKVRLSEDQIPKKVDPLIDLANQARERDMMGCEDLNVLDPYPGQILSKEKEITWAPLMKLSDELRVSRWLNDYENRRFQEPNPDEDSLTSFASKPIKRRHKILKRHKANYIKELKSLYHRVKEGTARVDEEGYEIFGGGHVHMFTPVRLSMEDEREKDSIKLTPMEILPRNIHAPVHKIENPYFNPHPRGVWVTNQNRITKKELGRAARDKWQLSADLKMNEILSTGLHYSSQIAAENKLPDTISKAGLKTIYQNGSPERRMAGIQIYLNKVKNDYKKHRLEVRKGRTKLYQWEKQTSKQNCTFLEENIGLRLITYCMTVFGVGPGIMCQTHENMRYWIIQKCFNIKGITSMGVHSNRKASRSDMIIFSTLIDRFI
jgi:hypothetical protein